jgi:hypothetical protein
MCKVINNEIKRFCEGVGEYGAKTSAILILKEYVAVLVDVELAARTELNGSDYVVPPLQLNNQK